MRLYYFIVSCQLTYIWFHFAGLTVQDLWFWLVLDEDQVLLRLRDCCSFDCVWFVLCSWGIQLASELHCWLIKPREFYTKTFPVVSSFWVWAELYIMGSFYPLHSFFSSTAMSIYHEENHKVDYINKMHLNIWVIKVTNEITRTHPSSITIYQPQIFFSARIVTN